MNAFDNNGQGIAQKSPIEYRTLGAAPSLNFFNLFWIFVITSFIGLEVEVLVSYLADGRWESRAGLVFGPFSPIYGIGGVLITAGLNPLRDRNPLVLFVVAGVIGASFEYFAGWFWESAFGIVAWSYIDQPFNFHGHTSLFMACVWGVVGLVWVRYIVPPMMRVIGLIPQGARMPLTAICAALMLADAALTLVAMDCWYLRNLGVPIETPWQEFCARYFGNEFMESRFETMSMWTVLAQR